MAPPQTDEQERRQQKISLERFLDSKRVWDATRTSREGFQGYYSGGHGKRGNKHHQRGLN